MRTSFKSLPRPKVIDSKDKALEAIKSINDCIVFLRLFSFVVQRPIPFLLAIDTETNGISVKFKVSPINDTITCWSICDGVDRYCIHGSYGEDGRIDSSVDSFLPLFDPIFKSKDIIKIFHNSKYDLHVFLNHKYKLNHPIHDTMVMHWLYDENSRHRLEEVAENLLGLQMTPFSKTFGSKMDPGYILNKGMFFKSFWDKEDKKREKRDAKRKTKKTEKDLKREEEKRKKMSQDLMLDWEDHYEKVIQYSSLDAYATFFSYVELRDKLKSIPHMWGSLFDYYSILEYEFTSVLFDMERAGVCINIENINNSRKDIEKRMEDIQFYFNKISENIININSNEQIGELFFKKLKYPILKWTKGGTSGKRSASVDAEALGLLKKDKKVKDTKPIDLLLEYRSLGKVISTYIENIIQGVQKSPDRRLHTTYNQHGTVSGRLSSSNPNSQNIKRPEEDEFKLRHAFIATPGKLLIAADYSQAEIRIIADLSGDEKLIEDLEGDVYKKVCSRYFEIPEEKVTSGLRKIFKTIVLGTNYQMGPRTLANKIDWEITPYKDEPDKTKVAGMLLDGYFNIYEELKDYIDTLPFIAKEREPEPYALTLLGRYRRLPGLLSDDWGLSEMARRELINTGTQGGVGDIMRGVMLKVHKSKKLKECGAQLLLQIHDEIVLEADRERAEEAAEEVVRLMKDPLNEYDINFSVPLEVDYVISDVWKKA